MKLLVVSNTMHGMSDNKQVMGWGSTVEQINALSKLFDEIRHLAILHPEKPAPNLLPYRAPNIEFVSMPPSGGPTLVHKLGILYRSPIYIKNMLEGFRWADVVFVRSPSNIGSIAILLLALCQSPCYRWAKYGGNWRPDGSEPWSFSFQRWCLHHGIHKGVVNVNGRWPKQPPHVYSFVNPSLTTQDIQNGQRYGSQKEINFPLYLLFVGRVNKAKGVGRILRIAYTLQCHNVDFELHIVGDGSDRPYYEQQAQELRLHDCTFFHGWRPKPTLSSFYTKAHFFLLPSATEGWPKVLSESMAYGVVPLASAVSSIPQILTDTGAGFTFSPNNVEAFASAIEDLMQEPERWRQASIAGLAAAEKFTYESYLRAVQKMFKDAWGIDLKQYS